MVQNIEVLLRGYRAGDVDAMYALDLICFEPAFRFSLGEMRRFAESRKARVILAEAHGNMVAFCIVHVDREGVGYVVTLDVAVAWRRRGLARMLLEEMERAGGCAFMMLHVYVQNAAAMRFYESMGYVRVGVERGFYGNSLDAAVYRKPLQT